MSFQEQSWHGSERMEISISPLSFSLSLLHSPPFLSILSPKRLKRRASCTLFPTLIWVQQKKRERESERGGVYTLLGVYYKAAITFRLFPPFPFHSHTLLTGSGRLPWWLDSITCDSFDLMSLSGSLYLFEQLRGNCVTLAVEDVLWRRTRWTEGTSRGSVAIINEGYFPQNAKTLCMCVSVCVSVCSWWGEQDRAMSPSTLGEFNCEMHIEVACTHSDHHFHWSEQNCFCACFLFLSKMSLGVTLRNFRALETSNAVLLVGLGGCWIDLQKHIAFLRVKSQMKMWVKHICIFFLQHHFVGITMTVHEEQNPRWE